MAHEENNVKKALELYALLNKESICCTLELSPKAILLKFDNTYIQVNDLIKLGNIDKVVENYILLYHKKHDIQHYLHIFYKVLGVNYVKNGSGSGSGSGSVDYKGDISIYFDPYTLILRDDKILISKNYNNGKEIPLCDLEEYLKTDRSIENQTKELEKEIGAFIIKYLAYYDSDSNGYYIKTRKDVDIRAKVRSKVIIIENSHPTRKDNMDYIHREFTKFSEASEFLKDLCLETTLTERRKQQFLMSKKLIPFDSKLIDPLLGCVFMQDGNWCKSGRMVETCYGFKSYECNHMMG